MSEQLPNEAFAEIIEQLPDVKEQFDAFELFGQSFHESYTQLLSHIRQARNRPELVGKLIESALGGLATHGKSMNAGHQEWRLKHPVWQSDKGFGGARHEHGLTYELYEIACTPLHYGYMEHSSEAINPCHDIAVWQRDTADEPEIFVNDEVLPLSGNSPRHQRQHAVLAEVITSLELAEIVPIKQHDNTS